MNKKTKYAVLAAIVIIGVTFYQRHTDTALKNQKVYEGTIPKANTNTYYLPSSTTGQIIHHNGYSLSYNEKYEQAEWVAYELKKEHLSKSNFKRPYFEIDTAVKTIAAHWRNYKNSGYDKGHLCPAGDKRYSLSAFNETFLTSNISPQIHAFNAGIWNKLEQKTRYWARKYNGVYVVTGGVLQDPLTTIGNDRVAVPKYFYKILLYDRNKQLKMIAFLIPHKASEQPLQSYVVTVDSIEKLTGIDFFANLEDSLENTLESSKSYKNWSFN